jgi:HK97 gp10 family phage protein
MASSVAVDFAQIVAWNRRVIGEAADVPDRVGRAVAAAAGDVEDRAVAMAPVRTGALRASIRTTGKGLRRRVAAGNAKAYYAAFQEFGTGQMSAHPFLVHQANEGTAAAFEARVAMATFAGAIFRGEG